MVAENLANRDSTGSSPCADPYRRKTVTFGAHVERGLAGNGGGGVSTVKVSRIGTAPGEFAETYDPAIRRPTRAATSSGPTSTAWSR